MPRPSPVTAQATVSLEKDSTLETLPRGPHKLPREEVVQSQRSRLLRAIAQAMAENGYGETSVADVLRRARVSRETFYQLFSSKQDCFIAAYEQAADGILALLERESVGEGPAIERFERTMARYLDTLAAEPEIARLFMIEVYAAGADALEMRAEVQRRFTALLVNAAEADDSVERFACEALVAAIITLVTARLAARDIEGLRALREPFTALVREALAGRKDRSAR